jgi:UPF0755 protein
MEWEDPFAQDEAAQERERRRAEREAKRRERQASVAEKVATPPSGDGKAEIPSQPPREPPPVALPDRPAAAHDRGPSDRDLWVRRIFGVAALAAALVLVFLAGKAVKSVLSSDDPDPEPAPKVKPTQTITIPEGLDRNQIAAVAKDEGLKGDYLKATNSAPKDFKLAKYGAKDAPNLEGFLFPDTWNDLPKKATVHDLVERQLADFEQRIKGIDLSYAESKNLNVYDVLKIASMVEREIQVPKERRLAAAVIYNRLAANSPLGIDATIRYEDQNYDEQLLESRLNTDTPYNTRTHPGLPPTPIANPGLASIEAAANPAKSDVFYFVVKPGTCGEHVFVKTQAEFNRAEDAYQQALQEQGGSPTDC